MQWLFLLSMVVGAVAGYWFVTRKPKPKFLLQMEYWVYLPGEQMPPQDEVMTWLVQAPAAISGREAILFSDVRLHIALVLRAKNAYLFRPDLVSPAVDATGEQLGLLEQAKSFARVRFLSEEPVPDTRYLKFLPQVARAIATLGEGTLIYDPIGERLLSPGELVSGDGGPNVRWVPEATGGHVATLGLKKRGVSEIQTEPISADERWIVSEIVGQVARAAWDSGELPSSTMVGAFDDQFRVDLEVNGANVAMARIHRMQGV
jgi:hypothetical protein